MRSSYKLLGLIAMLAVLFTACKKDDDNTVTPSPSGGSVNEEEVITTVVLTLQSATDTAIFTFRDLDGDGGNAPVITNDTLSASTTYNGSLLLLNESGSEVDTISNEVADEALEHQFFFQAAGTLNLTTSYQDQDSGGNPIGLLIQAVSGAASNGTYTVTLRHQPDKNATGVSGGDITNAGGETDIEVIYTVVIQ